MRLQPIFDIAEICAQKGVKEAILCPGSRCAPLTLAFTRHDKIQTRTISDERSAAFIALGIALATSNPVVLICTSGSAAYNFAPAIAEAYFQNIPLIVITADRPKEWIDQLDGQTIRQANLYGSHVVGYFELPQDFENMDSQWYINRIVNEAINLSKGTTAGPVHINVPLREPLYPNASEQISFSKDVRIISEEKTSNTIAHDRLTELRKSFESLPKVVLVVGQSRPNSGLAEKLQHFSKANHVPIVTDIVSNQHCIDDVIAHSDLILAHRKQDLKKALQPDLLITMGKSVVSKNLKLYLREYAPKQHWHIQESGEVADTFKSLTQIIRSSPLEFLEQFGAIVSKSQFESQKRENFSRLWQAEEHRVQRSINEYFSKTELSEFHLVREVLTRLPANAPVHLANSMAVRYAIFIGLDSRQNGIKIFCNRGTSGIDGCTSTTIGHSLSTDELTFLITGDMAFFYDRNAFWHNYKLSNLRIVVLNNHGGAIFKMIDGPGNVPEAEEYFVTNQKLTVRSLAQEFDFDYLKLDSLKKVKNLLKDFMEPDGRTKILEIETSSESAQKTIEEFKEHIRKSHEA
ncbi:MAG: 2-succinyl-5-enolpyruvyl-6-hydroxy-3-cyclohexene-1-carboxylic-acid synthase [Cyclobacteriaceae bacterium]|nr:2-succinyl-5-enolpyruvyl-6-hydroxy-3-cyclohexene-1-carboxylic-acid synthase [Cyclobacteriaceae bacterium]